MSRQWRAFVTVSLAGLVACAIVSTYLLRHRLKIMGPTVAITPGGAPAPSNSEQVRHPEAPVSSGPSSGPSSVPPGQEGSSPIPPPESADERADRNLERRREPYYRDIRAVCGGWLALVQAAPGDPATVQLYLSPGCGGDPNRVLGTGLEQAAFNAGFRRLKVFSPDPSTQYRTFNVATEGTADGNGGWTFFQR